MRKPDPIDIIKPEEAFMEDFGVTPDEALRGFAVPGHPLLTILRHLRNEAMTALIDEEKLVPDGYRMQGVIRALDNVLGIPDRIKEFNA